MFRGGLKSLFENPQKYNFIKYGWYSYFYFSHRACRRILFIFHIVAFITNFLIIDESSLYAIIFTGQALFYVLAIVKVIFNFKGRLFYYPYYYSMTLVAQVMGTYNHMMGKSKPFWDKAESTR